MVKKPTDTVKAKLTPGEAVLTRNAAELLGRDTIKRLNDHGNMLSKRGVDLASLQSDPAPYPASENLAGLQMGTADVGRDDRADLLKDAENAFYGGGTAPMPTPTPTPRPDGYQYGTDDVRRRRTNAASRLATNYSTFGSNGVQVRSGNAALAPEDNPAYQAALARNPTPASRYAAQRSEPASMVGTYRSDYGPRAVISTGANRYRTYDPEGGYIGRTGNAADFLNKQFSPNPAQTAPAPNPATMVNTTPTSVSINTGQQFQPYNLEPNPFTQPASLTLEQPRRYSDLY